jgi:hypothetical protein
MEETNWIYTHFIPLYKLNADRAYQTVLEHGVARISLDTSKGILRSDNTLMDFTLIANQIPAVVEQINRGIFVDSTNGLTPMTIPITEVNPRVAKDEADRRKALEFYNKLRGSITGGDRTHSENELPDDCIFNLGKCLKELHGELDVIGAAKTQHYFLIGKILLAMKNKDKQFMKIVKEEVRYSPQHAYFLIDFYKTCVEYPKLKRVSVPIGKINNCFGYIKFKLNEDRQFWS